MKKNGFTLIELIIAIVMLAVFLAVFYLLGSLAYHYYKTIGSPDISGHTAPKAGNQVIEDQKAESEQQDSPVTSTSGRWKGFLIVLVGLTLGYIVWVIYQDYKERKM